MFYVIIGKEVLNMDKKIILFDVDGTLIDCQNHHTHLTVATKNSLRHLKALGYYIFIASGRPYCFLLDELKEFDFDGYILDDGAYILFHDQCLAYHPIAVHKITPIIQQVKQKNLTFVGYTQKKAYFYHDDGSLLNYCRTFVIDEQSIENIDDINSLQDQFLKIHVQAHSQQDYQDILVNPNDFYSANDQQHYLKEIYSTQYTKATALHEVLEAVGIRQENSYFFGDGLNDIEMMQTVGHAIAMGNADPIVKKQANYICKSVDEDGVADFIEHSGLFF